MRRGWGRWRGYMDELEVVMRQAAERLAEAEALIAKAWERPTWHKAQRESVDSELLRRAQDMPFLGRLLAAARGLERGARLEPPDFTGHRWQEGEQKSELSSIQRFDHAPAPGDPLPRSADDAPPARLQAAERALAERTRSMVVLLDDLVNPRNASAVIRTSEALGLQEVHIVQAEGRVDLERTVTMLAERWLDLYWYRDMESAVEALKGRGYRILVSDYSPAAEPLDRVPLGERVAVAFGSEQRGVSETLRAAADGFFFLPSAGFTSYLNVSVMAGVSLYTLDQRMRAEGLRAAIGEQDRAELRRAWYTALAKGDHRRAREFLGWLENPPKPAAARGAAGSRRGPGSSGMSPPVA
ncbi:MAG: RNA methyltransferase [Myxococcota bacterium]|nr:RNA methyltransferase [Myxococcota bacterium]